MRWDELFADLEGQLEAGLSSQERDLEAEEERLRLGRLSLRDRLVGAAHAGEPVRVALQTGGTIRLLVRTTGRDWLAGDLADRADGAQAVLSLPAVVAFLPTERQLVASLDPPPAGALTDRLGLSYVLRDLARRRRRLQLLTLDGATLAGTIDRVGRDHADLAEHPLDVARRAGSVHRIRVVSLAHIALVTVA